MLKSYDFVIILLFVGGQLGKLNIKKFLISY
jgi:hypothetical protein